MTHDQDPTRWTSSPEEAPELLRGAFAAGRNEGPSRLQMRSLALKIAAASAGGAVAVGSANASATHAAASAVTWSVGKIASVIAIAGTIATGAVVWQQAGDKPQDGRAEQRSAQMAEPQEVIAELAGASHGEAPTSAEGPTVTPLGTAAATWPIADSSRAASELDRGSAARAARSVDATTSMRSATSPRFVVRQRGSRRAATVPQAGLTKALRRPAAPPSAPSTTASEAQQSEIELLRSAQLALQSRPREAYELTQRHRRAFPAGEFAQERDALAIQALMRAGETEMARDLAESFIAQHPGSPHAHRFREAMGIR